MAEFVAGDTGGTLRATIRDSFTKQPVDLSGKTVQLRYSLNGRATEERTMIILDQAIFLGKADYPVVAGDFPEGGEMIGEARLQDGLPDQLTTVDSFHVSIKAPLPEPAP